jgi:hypothetical protein
MCPELACKELDNTVHVTGIFVITHVIDILKSCNGSTSVFITPIQIHKVSV